MRCCSGLVLAAAVLLSCKEKEPYPSRPAEPVPAWDEGRAPEVAPEVLPIALVHTPSGTILVVGTEDGARLDVKQIQDWVYARRDGSLARLTLKTEKVKAKKESSLGSTLATLIWSSEGQAQTVFPQRPEQRPDVARLASRMPDLAKDFYYDEALLPVGGYQSYMVWLAKIRGFTGGAHDYSESTLLVVDMESGKLAEMGSLFQPDIVREEALKGLSDDACVGEFSGFAPIETVGGRPQVLALLTHRFEVCRGETRFVALEKFSSKLEFSGCARLRLDEGTLKSEDGGFEVPGVVDFRASRDGKFVVMAMALGPNDKMPAVSMAQHKAKAREIRLWVRKGSNIVLGRATAILQVQFLHENPNAAQVLEALTRL